MNQNNLVILRDKIMNAAYSASKNLTNPVPRNVMSIVSRNVTSTVPINSDNFAQVFLSAHITIYNCHYLLSLCTT